MVCEITTTIDETGVQGVARNVTELRQSPRAAAVVE